MFKDMFKKVTIEIQTAEAHKETANVPEGLWRKCNKCGKPIISEDVKNNYYICPKCKGYFRMHAYRRVEMITDVNSFEEWKIGEDISNPLDFPGYEKKLAAVKERTKLSEAIIVGKATIEEQPVVLGICDARFFMGSMGEIVGERIAGAVERATKEKLPVIIFACSGGARMQEGIVSLMQMAKTSAVLKRHSDAGLLYISVLTDPTTGGVTASFAMLGDIIIAEPKALIGFAGPRVIEQTIGQKLPEGFQSSEFLLEHGFIDAVVKREALRAELAKLLRMHKPQDMPMGIIPEEKAPISTEGKNIGVEPWERVKLSRKSDRLTALDYIGVLFEDFTEFHGDRVFRDDGALIGGVALFNGMPVTVLAQQKGKSTKENIKRNFGMPYPEGYRKALRLMKQAEKFGRPIICLVDTPGAFCGIEAEERGQGEAIARNLFEMSGIKVPILSIVIGEGGSGGALALAVADEVWMLENAIYSILSPEGFASILWKDSKKANEAAKVMRITAADLMKLGIIDRIIDEEQPANKEQLGKLAMAIKHYIGEFLSCYMNYDTEMLINKRYDRFRRM
jgi:acetyl-CoA carboxylase, carboxyl transferase, alpha subunit/acetyl-CoA carboxylase, carboxyl transferase, beta subunit